MCAENMRLEVHERTERVPGAGLARTRTVKEWVCPECDNFEEAEEDAIEGGTGRGTQG
jgi:hypothetical protein